MCDGSVESYLASEARWYALRRKEEAREGAARAALARVLAEEEASVVEACMVEWDRRGFGTSRGEDGAAAWRRSVYSAFGRLSVAARGAMVEVLVAEYNCSYICGREWCRRQGERHRWRVEVWWPGRGSLVVMGEGIAGEVEGWREQVRAGQHLLLTEDPWWRCCAALAGGLADSIIRLRTTSSMARTTASKEAVVCALLVPARASPVPSVVPPP